MKMLSRIHRILFLGVFSLSLNACGGGGGDGTATVIIDSPPLSDDIMSFISGTIVDRSTNKPIKNALVKTVPPTEVRLTDKDGGYLVRNGVFEKREFEVIASQIGYGKESQFVTVGVGGSGKADFSLDTAINGLVASLSILQITQGKTSGTFLLSSTLDDTGFSFQSSNASFMVEPSQGTLSKNELIVIDVKFTPQAGDSDKVTGQLVANASNGGTPAVINVSVNATVVGQPNSDNPYAVLVDSNNELVTDISGSQAGFLPDSDSAPIDPETIISWNFEGGQQDWSADNGLWEIGVIPAGTDTTVYLVGCYEGTSCAGTVLGGNYPAGTNSRMVGPAQTLPTVSGDERLTLRFWQRFAFGGGDSGRIQLSVDNGSNWLSLGTDQSADSAVWSRRDIDITEYAGQIVQIGFFHLANVDSSVNFGWFLDSISIRKHIPSTTSDFEPIIGGSLDGAWADWSADNGVWEIGPIRADTGMAASLSCHTGSQCAGTVLDSNYPAGTNSRLVSPLQRLPTITGSQRLTLRFWQWFSWGGGDSGRIQLTLDNGATWTDLSTGQSANSSVWTRRDLDLTDYAGQSVQIGFLHLANVDSSVNSGWFLDGVEIFVR